MLQEFALFGVLKVLITCSYTYTCSLVLEFDEIQFAAWCIRAELQTDLTLDLLVSRMNPA